MTKPVEIFYLLLLTMLASYGVYRYFLLWLFFKVRSKSPMPAGSVTNLPGVTIQIPVYNERYVVERIIRTACEVDYPKQLLQVHVLDDSTDDTSDIVANTLKRFAGEGLQVMHLKRNDRKDFKAGALEEALKHAKGDVIAIFDADFIVPRDFLMKTVGFFADPKIGIVQARWSHMNSDYSFLTRLQSVLLDGHFAIEQTARQRTGRFFNFNGTAGIWRKEAIISSGGWQAHTLAEDLDMSYRAQLAGWKGIYLNDLAVQAEIPVEVSAFKNQQYRWAKGSIQVAKKLLPQLLAGEFPLKVKIEAIFHLGGFFTYLVGFLASVGLPLMLMGVFEIPHRWYIDTIWFLLLAVPGACFYLCAQKELYSDWKKRIFVSLCAVSVGVALSANNALAVLDGIFGRRSAFVRTSKYGIKTRLDKWTRKTYKSRLTPVAFIELFVAAYFCFGCAFAFYNKLWLALPSMVLMCIGFAYLGGMSLWQNTQLQSWASRILYYRESPVAELES